MRTIISNQKILFGQKKPEISLIEGVFIDDIEVGFECGGSMIGKKIKVIFYGGNGQLSTWPITLESTRTQRITKLKLEGMGWIVNKIEIEPEEEDYDPIYFSLFKSELIM